MAFTDNTTGGRVIEWYDFPVKITMSEACEPADLICYGSTAIGWFRADGNVTGQSAQLIAGERGSSGNTIQAYGRALIDFGTACSASVVSLVYLSNTDGEYGISSGTSTQVVGHMLDTRRALIEPHKPLHAGLADVTTDTGNSSLTAIALNTLIDVLELHGMLRHAT